MYRPISSRFRKAIGQEAVFPPFLKPQGIKPQPPLYAHIIMH